MDSLKVTISKEEGVYPHVFLQQQTALDRGRIIRCIFSERKYIKTSYHAITKRVANRNMLESRSVRTVHNHRYALV